MKTPHSRRRFIGFAGLAVTAPLMSDCGTNRPDRSTAPRTQEGPDLLPAGTRPARAPLSLHHFPSRLHAFVWRNWPLVPIERMAEVIGAGPQDVPRLGAAMGLGAPPRISVEQQRRSYITVIKRNWHILPYDQLLNLLGWGATELAYTLREDDFLWIKLGGLKPHCEPLRWAPSNEAAIRREAEISNIVQAELGRSFRGAWNAMFGFIPDLKARSVAPPRARANPSGRLRFCYSYFALYGDPLLDPGLDPYPDGYLERLAATGVNGVWLQAVLFKLHTFPWQPERSEGHEKRLQNLAALVARAKRHGIRVFLYLNEPRSMPIGFFAGRKELQGVVEGEHAALCSSDSSVRRFLAEAVAAVCAAVPDLGGFFTITASENLTNCWSHGRGKACSRCGSRAPAEVIAEVNATIKQGLDAARLGQELLVWDWGWDDAWAPDAIARLPVGVSLMSVSEWSLPISRGGVKAIVGEYSLSAIGPGPRATRHWRLAKQRGLKTVAKIQANNTWELSALPYLPVLANVARHAGNLRGLELDGIMLSWTLGGYPSPNIETVAAVMDGEGLGDVARRRFGPELAPAVLAAWNQFSQAFGEFPFDGGVVYSAPLQAGPANLLWQEPTRYRCSMVGFPYDDLDGWRGPYPREVFIEQLQKVAAGFAAASADLMAATTRASGAELRLRQAARQEAALGRAAGIHFRSVANQARFVFMRDRLGASTDGVERGRWVDELESVVRDELEMAKQLWTLQSLDTRLGFEASNHYFYVPVDLAEKILNCRHMLDEWLPAQRTAVQAG